MYPFERFTEQAKGVLAMAQEEAERSRRSHIGTEHMLFGLFREERGVARAVLGALGVQLADVRGAVEALVGEDEDIVIQQIIPTARVKKVIEIAFEQARGGGDGSVGTEHLLLGVLIEGRSAAARVLTDFNITVDAARAQIARVRAEGRILEERVAPQVRQVSQRRYSDQALRVLRNAERLTGSPLRGEVQPEDLLRALLDQDEFTRHVLSRAGADVERVRHLAMPPDDLRLLQDELRKHRLAKDGAVARYEFEEAAAHRAREQEVAERLAERRRAWIETLE